MAQLRCGGVCFFGISAVIFDKDGTLADSHGFLNQLAYCRSHLIDAQIPGISSDLMAAFGCQAGSYDPQGLMAVGTRYENEIAAAAYVAATGVPWGQAVAVVRTAFLQSDRTLAHKASKTLPLLGIPQLLQHLRDAGIKLAVLSGDTTANIQDFLQYHRLADLVEWSAGSEAPPVKPDPRMLQAACEQLSVAPSQVVVVGDSVLDYQLAAQGQAQGFISVTWGGSPAVPDASVVLSCPETLQAVPD